MRLLQLFREGEEIIASDGIMYVDGRISMQNTKIKVEKRNESFRKNFPHKVADSFAVYNGKTLGSITKL